MLVNLCCYHSHLPPLHCPYPQCYPLCAPTLLASVLAPAACPFLASAAQISSFQPLPLLLQCSKHQQWLEIALTCVCFLASVLPHASSMLPEPQISLL